MCNCYLTVYLGVFFNTKYTSSSLAFIVILKKLWLYGYNFLKKDHMWFSAIMCNSKEDKLWY